MDGVYIETCHDHWLVIRPIYGHALPNSNPSLTSQRRAPVYEGVTCASRSLVAQTTRNVKTGYLARHGEVVRCGVIFGELRRQERDEWTRTIVKSIGQH